MDIRAVIDARHQDASPITPATPLAGVPLILWAANHLVRAGVPRAGIAIIDPDQRCARAIARHNFSAVNAPPANTGTPLRADWQHPFRIPASEPSDATQSIRITDADTLALAEAVARGLPPADPRIAGVRRYALPTDRAFRAVITDVDGCLTDGTVIRTEQGDAMRAFNTKDGIAHRKLQAAGIKVGWLSTAMECNAINDRARSLGVDAIDAGSGHKGPRFESLCAKLAVKPEEVVFMGDDIHDLPAMRLAGAMACPADAHPHVRAEVDCVLAAPGGRGAFRELADLLTDHITEHQLKL